MLLSSGKGHEFTTVWTYTYDSARQSLQGQKKGQGDYHPSVTGRAGSRVSLRRLW